MSRCHRHALGNQGRDFTPATTGLNSEGNAWELRSIRGLSRTDGIKTKQMGGRGTKWPSASDRTHHVGRGEVVGAVRVAHFVLEDVEVVDGRHGDDVVVGVPGRVQDLLVEVQTVHADLVLLALAAAATAAAAGADPARLQQLQRQVVLAGRLQGGVTPLGAVEHAEEVVVRARHDNAERGRERERQRRPSECERENELPATEGQCNLKRPPLYSSEEL